MSILISKESAESQRSCLYRLKKGWGQEFCLSEPRKEGSSANILILAQWCLIWNSYLQNCKIIHFYCLNSLNLWWFGTEAKGYQCNRHFSTEEPYNFIVLGRSRPRKSKASCKVSSHMFMWKMARKTLANKKLWH